MFLHGISLSEYADIITTIKSNLDIYWHADDNGFLPQHLCLHGIAKMLHENANARVQDIGSPRIHLTQQFNLD
jgi:hypothetical protein